MSDIVSANHAVLQIATPTCGLCGKGAIVTVPPAGWRKWMEGALVQDAFPDLDANVREQLITGTHPECWEKMWADAGD